MICGWRVGDSICIREDWHEDAVHHMVSIHELESSA